MGARGAGRQESFLDTVLHTPPLGGGLSYERVIPRSIQENEAHQPQKISPCQSFLGSISAKSAKEAGRSLGSTSVGELVSLKPARCNHRKGP